MFDGIVFDCDGVLFESTAANLAFYNSILRQMRAPEVDRGDRGQVRLCHTAASAVVLTTLLGEERGQQALELAGTMGYEDFIPHMDPEEGAFSALAALKQHWPLAVATNRGGSIGPILEHFQIRDHFCTVVCCRDVERPKPAPDMLLLAARQLGLSCESLLFVGDSDLDRQAAAAAGVSFAAYKTDVPGDYSLGSFSDLLELLSVPSSAP